MKRFITWWLVGFAVATLFTFVWFTLPLEILLITTFGWAYFLWQTMQSLTINWSGVATGMVALVALLFGIHWFGKWVMNARQEASGENSGSPTEWKRRWSLHVVLSVVLFFVAGIAVVGAAHQAVWLVSSADPVFKQTWEGATRTQSKNNLKMMGFGMDKFVDANGRLPAGGTFDARGRPMHGWQTMLLPYIDQQSLFATIDLEVLWDQPRNAPAMQTTIDMYTNPVVPERDRHNSAGQALSGYAANGWLLGGGPALGFREISDGASHTILAGDVRENLKPWGHPVNWRDPGLGIGASRDGFGGSFVGGAQFLMADGAVRFINKNIKPELLKALSTPNGGETVDDDY